MIESIAILLIATLAIILSYYNQRMAVAIRGIERVVQDHYALQIRDRRSDAQTRSIDTTFNPLAWVSDQVNTGLNRPVQATEIIRLVPDMKAVDLRTTDNRRLVVSTLPISDILHFDKRLRAGNGRSAEQRLEAFASRPLLTQSRTGRGVQTIERVLSDTAEFFDLEAQAAGTHFGTQWQAPTRLWFYVVE